MPHVHAFRMRLKPGRVAAYEAAHDALWPELADLLRQAGISDDAIWHDPGTDRLFGHVTLRDDHALDALCAEEIMRRWWTHMAPMMETRADDSPVTVPLRRVFRLP